MPAKAATRLPLPAQFYLLPPWSRAPAFVPEGRLRAQYFRHPWRSRRDDDLAVGLKADLQTTKECLSREKHSLTILGFRSETAVLVR